jgi:hypothetical protein
VFDKFRQVNQAAIVENKHLDAALMIAKLMQKKVPPRNRNNNEPGRRSLGSHMFAVPSGRGCRRSSAGAGALPAPTDR